MAGKTIQCPVCKEEFSAFKKSYLGHSLKLHIINTAKNEVWRKKLGERVSQKHYKFYKKHYKKRLVKSFEL